MFEVGHAKNCFVPLKVFNFMLNRVPFTEQPFFIALIPFGKINAGANYTNCAGCMWPGQ